MQTTQVIAVIMMLFTRTALKYINNFYDMVSEGTIAPENQI